MVAHPCNPRTKEAEVEGSLWVQSLLNYRMSVSNTKAEAGELVHWSRVLTALLEDPGSLYTTWQFTVTLVPGNLTPFAGVCGHQAFERYTNRHTCKHFYFKKYREKRKICSLYLICKLKLFICSKYFLSSLAYVCYFVSAGGFETHFCFLILSWGKMFSNKIREKSYKLLLNASKEMLGFFSFKFKNDWIIHTY